MATHSSVLAGEFHGQRSLMGYSPWGHEEWNTIERYFHISSQYIKLTDSFFLRKMENIYSVRSSKKNVSFDT